MIIFCSDLITFKSKFLRVTPYIRRVSSTASVLSPEKAIRIIKLNFVVKSQKFGGWNLIRPPTNSAIKPPNHTPTWQRCLQKTTTWMIPRTTRMRRQMGSQRCSQLGSPMMTWTTAWADHENASTTKGTISVKKFLAFFVLFMATQQICSCVLKMNDDGSSD